MSQRILSSLLVFLALLVAAPIQIAEAQIGGVIQRAVGRTDRTLGRAIDRAIDDAVKCAIGDKACADKAKADGKAVVVVDADGKPVTDGAGNVVSDPEEAAKLAQKPGEGVWRNYDFTPGKTVWVATDFANEPVGRFPAKQLEFVSGNMEIVELNGEKVLEVSAASTFRIPLPATLEEDFTLEFYMKIGAPNMTTNIFFSPVERSISQYQLHYLSVFHTPGIYQAARSISSQQNRAVVDGLTPVKLQADGDYVIVYVGTNRVANIPNATIERTGAIEFRVVANANYRTYVKDIVVAVGVDKMYDALMASGEFVTRGILFEVDSDVLKPESTPALEEIRSTLTSHADLNVVIEGHTDSTGTAEHNLDLSQRRARAVVSYLVANGVDAGRLTAVGKGETEPVSDNATPAGRAGNRRVTIRKPG